MAKIENKSKQTFSERIRVSNVVMASITVFCIVLFNIINSISVDKYNEITIALKSLNSFYDHVSKATSFVKDYLYTENEVSLINYEEHINLAANDMQVLKLSASADNYYRFVMLDRMLTSYEGSSQDLIANFAENKSSYQTLYNNFLNAGTLIEKTSDSYYNIISKEVSAQLDNLRTIKNSTVLASVLLLGILLVWLMHYSHQLTTAITKPITLLLKNITRIKEGEYDLSQVSNASKEMEDLCDAMNDMAFAIQRNIESTKERANLQKQILEWKNENLKKDEMLAQSELKMLQNQINPHFLFNTLNMIYKLAISEGAPNAANILIKTSQLLRYGLDKQSKLSDIKSEVEMLENYISIQQIRLGNRVHFATQYKCLNQIGSIAIPGMILQPLVENAIKHGLNDCLEDGEIEIRITGDSEEVLISIGDNGKGMASDELEAFILNDYQRVGGNHLGLYNVVKRLQMYYGERVSINFNSDLDCGFEIMIVITI